MTIYSNDDLKKYSGADPIFSSLPVPIKRVVLHDFLVLIAEDFITLAKLDELRLPTGLQLFDQNPIEGETMNDQLDNEEQDQTNVKGMTLEEEIENAGQIGPDIDDMIIDAPLQENDQLIDDPLLDRDPLFEDFQFTQQQDEELPDIEDEFIQDNFEEKETNNPNANQLTNNSASENSKNDFQTQNKLNTALAEKDFNQQNNEENDTVPPLPSFPFRKLRKTYARKFRK